MLLITKDYYDEKLKEFVTVYPQANKVSGILYVDWSGDLYGTLPESEYELRFLELAQQQKVGYLSYLIKGSYRHSEISQISRFSLCSGKKNVWVHRWDEDKEMYVLSSNSPQKDGYQGCASYHDFSFQKGSLLIHESYSKHPLVESFREKTKNILDSKYKQIEKIALEKNYKHGWVYHRMSESIPELNNLWQSIGCYYLCEKQAGDYMRHFQYYHRPETLKYDEDDWD